jgi:very-short-patch-repair endonuclease
MENLNVPVFLVENNKKVNVLTEESFVALVLNPPYINQKTCIDLGVTRKCYNNSIAKYREQYEKDLKKLRSLRHSEALKGNQYGKREPKYMLDSSVVQEKLDTGESIISIAKTYQVPEYAVRTTIAKYNLKSGSHTYKTRPSAEGQEYVTLLSRLNPAVQVAYNNYQKDSLTYFFELYKTFLILLRLIFFCQREAKAYSYYRERGKISKSEICWSMNAAEAYLSTKLLEAGISHKRQIKLGEKGDKNYMFDFLVDRVLVEIDGEFHAQQETQERDQIKEELAKEKGFSLLRFTTAEIYADITKVIQRIEDENQIN